MDVSFAGKIIELNVGGFPATELMTQEGLQMAGIIVIRFFTKTILVLCQYVLGDSMFFFLTCSNLRSFFHVAHGIVWIRCSVSIPLLILGYIVFNGQQYTYRNGTGTGTVHSVSHATWMIIRICVSHDSCEGQCLNLLFSFSATFFWLSNPHFSIICHHFPSFAIIFPLRSWL